MQADQSIARRMDELAVRAARTGIAQIAWFLTPAEQLQAEISAKKAGIALFCEGGYRDAERRVAAFAEEAPTFPIVCLTIRWSRRARAPGHRDLLGSILGLGFERRMIGDILVGAEGAQAFVLREVSEYVAANLTRAGSIPVTVTVGTALEAPREVEAESIRVTVSSVRLDAVLAAAWKLSRGAAADLVSGGKVQVNHQVELRPDKQVSEGAVLSIRGRGRLRIESIEGQTKKGRTALRILRS